MGAFVFHAKCAEITKYLKQEVDEDSSICVDKHSLCGLLITDISRFSNITRSGDNDITSPNKEVPYGLLSKHWLDDSSPSVTKDKEIPQGHMIMK